MVKYNLNTEVDMHDLHEKISKLDSRTDAIWKELSKINRKVKHLERLINNNTRGKKDE